MTTSKRLAKNCFVSEQCQQRELKLTLPLISGVSETHSSTALPRHRDPVDASTASQSSKIGRPEIRNASRSVMFFSHVFFLMYRKVYRNKSRNLYKVLHKNTKTIFYRNHAY